MFVLFSVTNHSWHNQRMASQWLKAVCVCVYVTFIFSIKIYLISIRLLYCRNHTVDGYISQMSGPPLSWTQTDALFWAQDFSVADLYWIALSIQSQQLQLLHLGDIFAATSLSGLEKWKNKRDKYIPLSIKLKELYFPFIRVQLFLCRNIPHTGRKAWNLIQET